MKTKYGKYIRTLTSAEKEKYYNAYMRSEGYSENWKAEDHIIVKVYEDRVYTVVVAFKKTTTGKLLPIYRAYHKCMEKFKAA
jgi:hypothetical protein